MRTSEVDELLAESDAVQRQVEDLFETSSRSVGEVLTDFVSRIETEGVQVSDVVWLNQAYGKHLPSQPDPNNFTNFPSRNGVEEISQLVRGLLNDSQS